MVVRTQSAVAGTRTRDSPCIRPGRAIAPGLLTKPLWIVWYIGHPSDVHRGFIFTFLRGEPLSLFGRSLKWVSWRANWLPNTSPVAPGEMRLGVRPDVPAGDEQSSPLAKEVADPLGFMEAAGLPSEWTDPLMPSGRLLPPDWDTGADQSPLTLDRTLLLKGNFFAATSAYAASTSTELCCRSCLATGLPSDVVSSDEPWAFFVSSAINVIPVADSGPTSGSRIVGSNESAELGDTTSLALHFFARFDIETFVTPRLPCCRPPDEPSGCSPDSFAAAVALFNIIVSQFCYYGSKYIKYKVDDRICPMFFISRCSISRSSDENLE